MNEQDDILHKKIGCGTILILCAIVGIAIVYIERTYHPKPGTGATQPTIGEQGFLRMPGDDYCIIAVSEAALDRAIDTAIAKDEWGWRELARDHQLFLVPSGTRILVLDYGGLGKRKIRVVEGNWEGRAGWVVAEHICAK